MVTIGGKDGKNQDAIMKKGWKIEAASFEYALLRIKCFNISNTV